MKIGYARENLHDRTLEEQIRKFNAIGVDKIYSEKASGKDMNRPVMRKMLSELKFGDTLYVSDFSRISRNSRDLMTIIDELKSKCVTLVSLNEGFNGHTERGKNMIDAIRAIIDLEHKSFEESGEDAIDIFKARKSAVGKTKKEKDEKFEEVYKMWSNREITAYKAAELLGVTRKTFYNRVNAVGYIMFDN